MVYTSYSQQRSVENIFKKDSFSTFQHSVIITTVEVVEKYQRATFKAIFLYIDNVVKYILKPHLLDFPHYILSTMIYKHFSTKLNLWIIVENYHKSTNNGGFE